MLSVLLDIVGFVVDVVFAWFSPKQRSTAVLIYKGAKKYVNYKRDILPADVVEDLEADIREAKEGLRHFNRDRYVPATNKLESKITDLPGVTRSALVENVEIVFVMLAIFFGIKAYVIQPFRIPTGSMQPSLNGIRAIPYEEEPSLLGKGVDMILYGSSYVHEVAQEHMQVSGMKQGTWLLLFTRTTVIFNNGKTIDLPCAQGEVVRYFEQTKGVSRPSFRRGETIVQARFDGGDLILVDRMSYHFRKPKLGEVFVFDTLGIKGIEQSNRSSRSGSASMEEQLAGTHYVKRLCGLPGDTVGIKQPNLLINGKVAQPWTIARVSQGKAPYNFGGYEPAKPEGSISLFLPSNQLERKLPYHPHDAWMNEYLALGDNTTNSLDSRYWGTVKQHNIVGPAMFALWPFTSHWGMIP